MSVIIKCVILFVSSLILVRFSGKKSLSQMTIATTVVMISVGAVMVGPLVDKGLGKTITALAIYIALLWIFEWLELRSRLITKIMTPPPTVVIENGIPYEDRLKKLHMTLGQLNMRLRKAGVGKLSDVEIGVMESNGELSLELVPEARPLTVRDLRKILTEFGFAGEVDPSRSGFASSSTEGPDVHPPNLGRPDVKSSDAGATTADRSSPPPKLSPLFRNLP